MFAISELQEELGQSQANGTPHDLSITEEIDIKPEVICILDEEPDFHKPPVKRAKRGADLQCPICSFGCADFNNYNRHLVTCTGASSEPLAECLKLNAVIRQEIQFLFNCSSCPYKATRKDHLKRHVISRHTPAEKMEWIMCDMCNFKTKRREHLKRHVLCKHTPDEQVEWFQCEECSHKTKRREHLEKHVQSKHRRV